MRRAEVSALVTLAFAPKPVVSTLLPIAVGGAGPEELLERARGLGGFEEWWPGAGRLESQLEALERTNTRIVLYGSSLYPDLLLKVFDPPLCLFVRGTLPTPDRTCVAIVGSRKSRTNCLSFAEDLARELANAGVPVVSGMARGVDSAAHAGCLDGGERTVAVLGCGVDVCYPRDNRRLLERILRDGAVVSEYPMGTGPVAFHFPARNRIIGGWCAGTVVVEAAWGGGGLITARYALEQNRTVFAVPGAVWNPLSSGPNELIRDGAVPVTRADDVLEEILGVKPRRQGVKGQRQVLLTRDEETLLGFLDYDSARHVDDLARLGHMPAAKALSLLLELEMRGLATQLRGLRFLRSGGKA